MKRDSLLGSSRTSRSFFVGIEFTQTFQTVLNLLCSLNNKLVKALGLDLIVPTLVHWAFNRETCSVSPIDLVTCMWYRQLYMFLVGYQLTFFTKGEVSLFLPPRLLPTTHNPRQLVFLFKHKGSSCYSFSKSTATFNRGNPSFHKDSPSRQTTRL